MTENINTTEITEATAKRGRPVITLDMLATNILDEIDSARVDFLNANYSVDVITDPNRFAYVVSHAKFNAAFRESKQYKAAIKAKTERLKAEEANKAANKATINAINDRLAGLSPEQLAELLKKIG